MSILAFNPFNAEAYFHPKHENTKIFENHVNPVIFVLIEKLSLSPVRWVPNCPGFNNFSGYLYQFVLAKVATSSIRVNPFMPIAVISLAQKQGLENILRRVVHQNLLYKSPSNSLYVNASCLSYFLKYDRSRQHSSCISLAISGLTHSCLDFSSSW